MTDATSPAPIPSTSRTPRSGRRQPSRSGLVALTALAALVCSAVVTQVFLAGLGLLVDPSYLAWHASFVHVIELAVLVMVVLTAFVGGARLAGLSGATLLLIGTQYALIHGFGGPVRALHSVNALVLFAISWAVARQAAAKAAEASARLSGGSRPADQRTGAGLGVSIALVAGAFILVASLLPLGGAAARSGGESGVAGTAGRAADEPGGGVFAQNCAGCHGPNGQGAVGPRLAGNEDLSDPAFVERRVRRGVSIMPAFEGRLSDEQIAAVVNHVRTSWGNDFDRR